MERMEWVLGLAAVAAALFAIDRLGLYAERRGWIYWRKVKPSSMGGALTAGLAEAFQPNRVHYVQEQRREKKRDAAQGSGADRDANGSGTSVPPAAV